MCQKKCVPNTYQEGDLNKGESVCLDRCAAKFFDVHMKISEQLQAEQPTIHATSLSGPLTVGRPTLTRPETYTSM